jgi:hypothetical protein
MLAFRESMSWYRHIRRVLIAALLAFVGLGLTACPLSRNHPCDKVQCESACGAQEQCICGKCRSLFDLGLPDSVGPFDDLGLKDSGTDGLNGDIGLDTVSPDGPKVDGLNIDALGDSTVDGTPVIFTVSPETDIVAFADVGGAVYSGEKVYVLTNDSANSITYSVLAQPSWLLEINPAASGTIAAGASKLITINVLNGYPFTVGNYEATLTFVGGAASESRKLNFTVYHPGDAGWKRYITIPIIEPAFVWSTDTLRAPQLLSLGTGFSTEYHLWYLGTGANALEEIGFARSGQVHQGWLGEVQPVLRAGTSGSWNEKLGPFSAIHTGTEFKLWYTGSSTLSPAPGVGHATSSDAINWNKANGGAAIFEAGAAGSWDEAGVTSLSVVLDDTTYKMYYVSGSAPQTVGLATSPDGVSWTRVSELSNFSHPTIDGIQVLKEGPFYRMWYLAESSALYYASSLDGLAWTVKATTPLLQLGTSGAFDSASISGPAVHRDSPGFLNMVYSGNGTALGYANSSE